VVGKPACEYILERGMSFDELVVLEDHGSSTSVPADRPAGLQGAELSRDHRAGGGLHQMIE
jgi:hypothetical protein